MNMQVGETHNITLLRLNSSGAPVLNAVTTANVIDNATGNTIFTSVMTGNAIGFYRVAWTPASTSANGYTIYITDSAGKVLDSYRLRFETIIKDLTNTIDLKDGELD
jgi:hypothetical protein